MREEHREGCLVVVLLFGGLFVALWSAYFWLTLWEAVP